MIVKTVLIDLDDTLWATTRNNQSALREVYEAREWSRWIDSFETLRDVYQLSTTTSGISIVSVRSRSRSLP